MPASTGLWGELPPVLPELGALAPASAVLWPPSTALAPGAPTEPAERESFMLPGGSRPGPTQPLPRHARSASAISPRTDPVPPSQPRARLRIPMQNGSGVGSRQPGSAEGLRVRMIDRHVAGSNTPPASPM
jgi:hypothetical protein